MTRSLSHLVVSFLNSPTLSVWAPAARALDVANEFRQAGAWSVSAYDESTFPSPEGVWHWTSALWRGSLELSGSEARLALAALRVAEDLVESGGAEALGVFRGRIESVLARGGAGYVDPGQRGTEPWDFERAVRKLGNAGIRLCDGVRFFIGDRRISVDYGKKGECVSLSLREDGCHGGMAVYAEGTRSCNRAAWQEIKACSLIAYEAVRESKLASEAEMVRLKKAIDDLPEF